MTISATMEFLEEASPEPYYDFTIPGVERKRIGMFHDVAVEVGNLREHGGCKSVEQDGFGLYNVETRFSKPPLTEAEKEDYFAEVEAHVRQLYDVKTLDFLDITNRTTDDSPNQSRPVTHAHNDYTEASARKHFARLHPDAETRQHGERLIQLNYWRAYSKCLRRAPLAILDPKSLSEDDLIACKLIYPDRIGEVYEVVHRPTQVWNYYSDMNRNEALIFKGFDSAAQHGARFVPHAAISLPDTPRNEPPRLSTEVRVLITV